MELSVPSLRIGKDLQWSNTRWMSNENPEQSITANARVCLRFLKGTMLITSITERSLTDGSHCVGSCFICSQSRELRLRKRAASCSWSHAVELVTMNPNINLDSSYCTKEKCLRRHHEVLTGDRVKSRVLFLTWGDIWLFNFISWNILAL